MVNHMSEAIGTSRWVRVRSFLSHEFQEMLPPTMFFFIGFNLILFTKRLFLADYLIQFSGFMIATTSALVVGKTVLLANMMPFMRRFDHGPLVQPILFKTMVYTLSVFVVRLLEPLVRYLVQGRGLSGSLNEILGSFRWDHFVAVPMWVLVLFLVFFFFTEIRLDHGWIVAHCLWGIVGNLATVIEHNDVVGNLHHHIHVVLDE